MIQIPHQHSFVLQVGVWGEDGFPLWKCACGKCVTSN